MRALFRRYRKDEDGAVLVEYAFIAPTLILCTLTILELGMIFFIDATMDTLGTQVSRWAKTGFNYGGQNSYTFKGEEIEGFAPGTRGDHYTVDLEGRVIMDGREGFLRDWLRTSGYNLLKPNRLKLTTRVYDNILDSGFSGAEASPYSVGEGDQAVAYTVSYKWDTVSPFLWPFFGEERTISTTVVVQNESF